MMIKPIMSTPEDIMSAMFESRHGRRPNLSQPKTFSEKIQYRKLHDRDVRLQRFSDKLQVKSLISERLGADWVIPTLWSGSALPPRHMRTWPRPYVLKANHGHGWNLFIRHAENDWSEIERITNLWMNSVFGEGLFEWGYSQIKPELLVEPFIGSDTQRFPMDYKFLVFGGHTHYICVVIDRLSSPRRGSIYDRNWLKQDAHYAIDSYPEAITLPPPKSFDRMLWAADRLGSEFSFVRVDFYEIDGHPFVGELTFYPASGNLPFEPPEFDEMLGRLWRYPDASQVFNESAPA